MFTIEFLPHQAILRWKLTGFWTVDVALRFKAALAAEMARARQTHRRFNSISDARDFPIQSAEVMKILAMMSRSSTNEGSRRLAILVSTALNGLQAQQSLANDTIRVFRDEAAALGWLAEVRQSDRCAKALS